MTNNKLKIEVFYSEKEKNSSKLLPKTSEYLTDKQLIPQVGDALTLSTDDATKVLGLEPNDIKHIMTVRRKWFRYSSADVAIFVHYETW